MITPAKKKYEYLVMEILAYGQYSSNTKEYLAYILYLRYHQQHGGALLGNFQQPDIVCKKHGTC